MPEEPPVGETSALLAFRLGVLETQIASVLEELRTMPDRLDKHFVRRETYELEIKARDKRLDGLDERLDDSSERQERMRLALFGSVIAPIVVGIVLFILLHATGVKA